MSVSYVWSQIFGALGVLSAITSYNLKNKNEILIALLIANAMYGIQYCLLNAWSGVLCCAVAVFRSIVYFYYEKRNKKKPLIVLIVFLAILIGVELLVYQDWYSLLPIIGTVGFTWTLWLPNTKHFRKAALLDPIVYFIYDIHVLAYVDLPGVIIEFIGALIAFVRLDILRKGSREKKDE